MLKKNQQVIFIVAIIILGGALAYGYKEYDQVSKNLLATTDLKNTAEKNLAAMKDENAYLMQKLSAEESRNNSFQEQITGLTSTIGTLDKLSKTDKELLQKYSKIYFLNENYVPESLSEISQNDIYEDGKIIRFHTKALPYLQNLLKAAKDSGNELQIISGYRSFGDQSSLKSSYKLTYGSGANAFSADQGYSEHQLGTALDFTTPGIGNNFEAFKTSNQYKWLLSHAYEYGFVLSYPEGNSYYQFEPWHWRFVGLKLALRLHNEGDHFYDLDQRNIDSYLINIFD
jgi:LAS superfamily LD-carboxypeptidase LdcB